VLKTGDAALGDGVTRHFFSLIMEKLHNGFELDIGKLQFSELRELKRIKCVCKVSIQIEQFNISLTYHLFDSHFS